MKGLTAKVRKIKLISIVSKPTDMLSQHQLNHNTISISTAAGFYKKILYTIPNHPNHHHPSPTPLPDMEKDLIFPRTHFVDS